MPGTGAIQTSVIGAGHVPAKLSECLGQPCHGRDSDVAVLLKINIGKWSFPASNWGSVELNTPHRGVSRCGPGLALELESHPPLAHEADVQGPSVMEEKGS